MIMTQEAAVIQKPPVSRGWRTEFQPEAASRQTKGLKRHVFAFLSVLGSSLTAQVSLDDLPWKSLPHARHQPGARGGETAKHGQRVSFGRPTCLPTYSTWVRKGKSIAKNLTFQRLLGQPKAHERLGMSDSLARRARSPSSSRRKLGTDGPLASQPLLRTRVPTCPDVGRQRSRSRAARDQRTLTCGLAVFQLWGR